MIIGLIHKGSGIGNQLHRYVATRVLAEDKGYKWDMAGWDFWKARFINVDSYISGIKAHVEMPAGKTVVDSGMPLWGERTNYYNPEINFIEDNTIIDGEFQDERYFQHRLDDIKEWLKVSPLPVPEDVCIINFRGGEFSVFPELFLTKEYWDKAIGMMKDINPEMKFEVHTDDPITAMAFFPEYECVHHPETNWRSIRHAKYSIIPNSSFPILPRLLKHHEGDAVTIAPRYWARRNVKVWSMPQNYYKKFQYI